MVILKIKDTTLEFKLPVSLSEINLDDGLSIQSIVENKEMTEYEKKISILNILTKAPEYVLKEIKDEYTDTIYENLPFLKSLNTFYYKIPFKIKGISYKLKNFDELIVKDFMEIEFNLKEDPIESIPETILLLVHKKSSKQLNILTEEDLLRELDFATALGIIGEFNKWKSKIQKKYFVLFEQEEDLEPEEQPEYNPEQSQITKGYLDVQTKWGWYHILYSISNSKMEADYWLEKPVLEFFTYLSYIKQRNWEIRRLNKH